MGLLLIRHGETALNAARVLQPQDTPLSARGLAQAEAVARRVAGLGPAALVASDLPRAVQTARTIAAATGLQPALAALLRERDFGDLRGRPYDALGFDPLAMQAAPEGGESQSAFLARVALAFSDLVALHARCGGPVVVVTHGLVIQAVLARHALATNGARPDQRLPNASLTIVGAKPPHEVKLVGCTTHLDARSAAAVGGLHGG